MKKYRQDNKDKIKIYSKKYREDNKDKIKIINKKYCEKNKDKIEIRHKKYREDNKDKIKIRQKKYYENNKDKLAIGDSRAKKKCIEGLHDYYVKQLLIKNSKILKREDIPQELIEAKRLEIQIKRIIDKGKQ